MSTLASCAKCDTNPRYAILRPGQAIGQVTPQSAEAALEELAALAGVQVVRLHEGHGERA